MLSIDDKQQILKRFPDIELSYESVLHKKVYSTNNIFTIIPKGQKAFLWITYWKGQNICLVLLLNDRGNVSDVVLQPACFSNVLALGTVIYGTIFLVNNLKHFSCENIYFYKGNNLAHLSVEFKLHTMGYMFKNKEIKQYAYTKQFLIIGLPISRQTYESVLADTLNLPYSVYGIQESSLQTIIGIHVLKMEIKKEAIFKVKADLQADIYNLYCWGKETPYGTALVQTYKSSVMMNTLFRHIKENTNLDFLEESDDEEEFENIKIDKFVNLEKSLLMKCVYNKKFRKWQPIEVISNNQTKLITYKEIQYLEK